MARRLSDRALQPKSETKSLAELVSEFCEKNSMPIPDVDLGMLDISIETLPIAELYIETAYQRLPNTAHIKNILGNFDPNAVMLPLAMRRLYEENSRLVVPDGQQRAIACGVKGYSRLKCIVINVKSLADEAKIFRHLNIDRRAVPTPVTHRNDLILGKEKSLDLERAIREAGYTVGEKSGNRIIRGISRLHTAGSFYGYDYVREALRAYSAIWPGHETVHLYLVSGIAMLLWSYLCETMEDGRPGSPTYDPDLVEDVAYDRLAQRITRTFPQPKLVVNYHKLGKNSRPAEAYRRESDFHYAEILVEAFNEKPQRKGWRRLDLKKVRKTFDESRRDRSERDEDQAAPVSPSSPRPRNGHDTVAPAPMMARSEK